MLGLIGVARALFSRYSQRPSKNNINMNNSVAVKNDLDAAATTLAATSVLGEPTLPCCVRRKGGGGAPIARATQLPTKMVEFYPSVEM